MVTIIDDTSIYHWNEITTAFIECYGFTVRPRGFRHMLAVFESKKSWFSKTYHIANVSLYATEQYITVFGKEYIQSIKSLGENLEDRFNVPVFITLKSNEKERWEKGIIAWLQDLFDKG